MLPCKKILEQPEVIGVLLAGAVAQGIADQHSDLDFYVVTNGKQRWRGCWVLEQTPIEYFFNPAEFLHTTIQNDAAALQILATGVVVLAHPELEKLQAIARAALSAPRPTNSDELEFDRFNTIECVLETRSAFGTTAYGYILSQAVVYIIKAIYRKNAWWEVRAKSVLSHCLLRVGLKPSPSGEGFSGTRVKGRKVGKWITDMGHIQNFKYICILCG
jgi:hypothetical protein